MAQYYGVVRSGESLSHYGVKGMKWGVRRKQKAFYKYMKKELKRNLKENKKLGKYEATGIKNIANKIPNKELDNLRKYGKHLDKVSEKANDYENYMYHLQNHENKKLSKELIQRMQKLNGSSDKAYNKYKNEMDRLTDSYLGKYKSRKIRTASINTYQRRPADYIFESALR